jgi:hypothetical protein
LEQNEIEQLVGEAENGVERLRSLYDQYFMGLERIEPQVAKKDVERKIQTLRRTQIRNTALRFRFQNILLRYNTFQAHWMRICRQIEDGTYKHHLRRVKEKDDPLKAARDAREAKKRALAGDVNDTERPPANDDDLGIDVDVDFDERGSVPDMRAALRVQNVPVEAAAAPAAPAPATPAATTGAKAPPLPGKPVPPPVPGKPAPPPGPGRPPPPPAQVAGRPAPAAAPATPPAPAAVKPPAARPALPPGAKPPVPPPGASARPAPPPSPAAVAAARPQPSFAKPAPKPAADTAALSDERVRQIYAKYVETRRSLKESTASITMDSLAKSLRDSSVKLQQKHAGKKVDFEVQVKDGKTVLKPIVK